MIVSLIVMSITLGWMIAAGYGSLLPFALVAYLIVIFFAWLLNDRD